MKSKIDIVLHEDKVEKFIYNLRCFYSTNTTPSVYLGKFDNNFLFVTFYDKQIVFRVGSFSPSLYTKLPITTSKEELIQYIYNDLKKDIELLKIQYKLAGKEYVQ